MGLNHCSLVSSLCRIQAGPTERSSWGISMVNRMNNLKIGTRIIIAMILPVLAFLFFAGLELVDLWCGSGLWSGALGR